jgi:Ca2+-binding RTX toxin-like protein
MNPRILITSLALFAALPGAAQAATITLEGDTLVYRSETGDKSSLYVRDSYPQGRVRFEDYAGVSSAPASCTIHEPETVDCDVPARIRVEFGSADDSFGFGDGYTLALPIEVNGGAGNDRLDGDADLPNREILRGGDGKDSINGYGGDDEIRGGAGDDELRGSGGADTVLGEDGNDTLEGDYQAAPAADVIDGGNGSDLLKDYVEYGTDIHPPANVVLDGVANDGREGEGDNVTSIERMIAYVSGRFVLTDGAEEWQVWSNVNSGRSVVIAGGGDDKIVGEDAVEEIDGGTGNDYLEGGKNHDIINGGTGRDTIYGDDTDASCNANYVESCVLYGNDEIHARDGEIDQIDCGAGTDKVFADPSDVVAANCETVERAAVPAHQDPKTTDPIKGENKGPGATAANAVLAGRTKLASALRKGFKLKVTGVAAGTKVVAKNGKKVVAGGTVSANGTATLKFTKAAARKLRRARSVKLSLSGGGLQANITLKR